MKTSIVKFSAVLSLAVLAALVSDILQVETDAQGHEIFVHQCTYSNGTTFSVQSACPSQI